MVEDLRLARLGFWDQGLVQDVKDILADFLKLGLNLLTVVANGRNVLVGALRLLFLLDRRDDAPRGTSSADDVLVCDRQQVSLINGELSAQLGHASSALIPCRLLLKPVASADCSMFRTLATSFIYVTISSYLSACSQSRARKVLL